jgi:ATP-dependent Clp protease adaptor protein ClpS
MAEKEPPPPPPPDEGGKSSGAGTATAVEKKEKPAKPSPDRRIKPGKLPPYNVVLLDDDDHSYEYVIEMLRAVFGYDETKAFTMAKEVDEQGRVIVLTTHKEKAELKRDQILAYGPDARIAASTISMKAIIEPAEG